MKNIALPISASVLLLFAACSDRNNNPSKDSGQDQVPTPVLNSGPETEAARATKAVQDSSAKTGKKDTVATSHGQNH